MERIDSDARAALNRHLSRALAHANIGRPTHAKLHGIALVRDLIKLGIVSDADLARAAAFARGEA